jgi:hypothetical protein
MDAGMTGGTNGDQQLRCVFSRAAVMDGALMGSSADAAGVVVALQDDVAVAAEAGAGMEELVIARAAEAADRRGARPTNTEQPPLRTGDSGARHKRPEAHYD